MANIKVQRRPTCCLFKKNAIKYRYLRKDASLYHLQKEFKTHEVLTVFPIYLEFQKRDVEEVISGCCSNLSHFKKYTKSKKVFISTQSTQRRLDKVGQLLAKHHGKFACALPKCRLASFTR